MLTIIRCNDSFVKEEILHTAKANLKQFPNLNSIFNNFASLSFNNSHNKNIIFGKCIKGDRDRKSIDFLRRLENALSNLIEQKKLFINSDGQVNTKFIMRMTSSDPWDFSSVISEIFIADYLLSVLGPSNFLYEEGKRNERKADFTITMNNRQYSLELRTLMKGTTKEKIETVFDEVCIHILDLLKGKHSTCNIVIRIDTSRLILNEKRQIDVKRSIDYLRSYFDKLDILSLTRSKITIDFEYIRRSFRLEENAFERNASQIFENIPFHTIFMFDKNASEIHRNISEWLDKITIKDLTMCPFDSLAITTNPQTSCVSISPIDVDIEDNHQTIPGAAASEMDKESFIRQINRALENKSTREQWKSGLPVIIVLDTYNWHFDYFEYEGFLKLRTLIEGELRKYPDISGVILFHEIIIGNEHYKFYDGRYVENKDCKHGLRVTESELQEAHILRKYDDPVITYDKRVDFRSLDNKQQVHRLMDLINLEPKITKEDKIELLNTIEFYLAKNEVDSAVTTRLEPLLRKYCIDHDAFGVDVSVTVEKPDLGPIAPVSIRALAAACQIRITKHNPTIENVSLSVDLYSDSNTLIREAICSNLIYLSDADFNSAFRIANQTVDDNWRVRFYLGKYITAIINQHEEEAFELINKIIEKFKDQNVGAQKDTAFEIALNILAYKALNDKTPRFKDYFDIILADSSYPAEVKKTVAFVCKGFLHYEVLFDAVIEVYTTLIKSPLPNVYEYASLHLFYNIKQIGKPYYKKVKPLLEILSRKSYNSSFPFWESANMIIYLEAFCRQIPVDDSVLFLERLCYSHPFLLNEGSENWKVLKILECLAVT